jgi:hypothetical protein
MLTGLNAKHNVPARQHRTDRVNSATQSFAKDQNVWLNSFMIDGQHSAGSSQTSLNFIGNK